MNKKIIFLTAIGMMSFTLQVKANVQSNVCDSIRYKADTNNERMLLPIEPIYNKGVLISSPWNGNWFVTVQGGGNAFLGSPIGCADLFDRIKPEISVSVGKWFTPFIGTRIGYGGWQFKDCEIETKDYHHFHADLMWNVLGGRYSKQERPHWGIVPYIGLGVVYNTNDSQSPFAFSYGIQGQYHISKRLTAVLEIGNLTTFKDFDGYGKASRIGDNMLSLSAGLSFNLGKAGWRRSVDANPYIRQNDWLIAYSDLLLERNQRYAMQHDRDMLILTELKKIMEIEGLLEKYGNLFEHEENVENSYPKNDYSGLNSLLARLKYRHWDGNSPLTDAQSEKSAELADAVMAGNDSINTYHYGNNADNANVGDSHGDSNSLYNIQDYLSFISSGDTCIGPSIYFFFELGTTNLTDASQLVNLDELARIAKKYGLAVSVVGAADSATGFADLNDALSASRADYIASELSKRGLDIRNITKSSRGGISDFNPTEANRHTKVMLFVK